MTRLPPLIPIRPADDEGLTRRGALQLMAASLALAGSGCTRGTDERIYPYVDMPEAGRGALPAYYASAFVRDGHAHGVLVGTREGRPIKIEGNRAHPSSLGATDVFAQASILELWDPDRSQAVHQQLRSSSASAAAGPRGAASATEPADARSAAAPPSARSPVEPPSTESPAEPPSAESPAEPPSAESPAEPPSASSTWAAFESAWGARAAALDARNGEGLAVLTPRFTSPTLALQLQALLQRYPQAHWHRHAPLLPSAARDGARLAFGLECDWVLHIDRATLVVTLDADPFSDEPGHVRHARDWSLRRAGATGAAPAGAADSVSAAPRAVAIETSPGLFGARADERIAMAPAEIDALADELGRLVLADAATRASTPASALARRLATMLLGAGAGSLVIAGRALSAHTHAQVAALNQRLGAIGRTLDAIEPLDRIGPRPPESLAALVGAIDGGAIDTLLIVGGNPAYDAPGDVPFAAALQRVPFSAHLSLFRDETSRLATWHLPASHDYECWGDARAHDGTVTLLQPAILPLYDTRSPIEWLALLAGADARDGHAIVQTAWRAQPAWQAEPAAEQTTTVIDDARFNAWWRRSLRAGLIAGTAAAPLVLARAALPGAPAGRPIGAPVGAQSPPNRLAAVFVPDASIGAGGFANNGWLQELPRPFTKLTWGNAIHLGPRTAARLGLATGDVVRATAGGRSLDAPVWVLAEHAENAATLPLGYGRRAAGRVGSGVGFDAFRLRASNDAPVEIEIVSTGRRHRFAVTQHRLDQDGRELARSVVAGAAIPAAHRQPSLYPALAYPEHAWAMAIDLDACIGCNACTIACQAENNIPVVGAEQVAAGREMHWIRVDRYQADAIARPPLSAAAANTAADTGSIFQPVPCMHCEDAPCEVVCPVGATVHDTEGLNVQVYNRCVGTRFCSNNCPYKVRRFNFLQYTDDTTETLKAMRNPDVTVRERGVMEKCTYCVQRLSRARLGAEKAGLPIADGDVVTACQSVCPTRAIHFGDLNDAASDVVRARTSPRHYAMLDELNTRPRTTYLARVVTGGAAPAPTPSKGPT